MSIEILALIPAIAAVESNNNSNAHNSQEDAVGLLQIRKICVDDVNRFSPIKYTYQDRWDAGKSKEIFVRYVGHYGTLERLGRKPTQEDYARIWNAGPNGYKKDSSKKYWIKVKNKL